MKLKIAFVLALIASPAFAAPEAFVLTPKPDGTTGITFSVGHTAGVHRGHAARAEGTFLLEPGVAALSGSFSVPIASMRTGNDKRDCHLREALGLDYSQSQYPDAHACASDNTLPEGGPDAVVYDRVSFELAPASVAALVPGTTQVLSVRGRWTIHGVTRESEPISLQVTRLADGSNGIRAAGTFVLKLSDFGAVVKSFLTISVRDTVTVTLDVLLAPAGGTP